jgi:DNA excision repair protein ERCC-4
MRILIDTREQAPFTFDAFPGTTTETATLPAGDYSLPGFTDRVSIEKKELNDLVGCLMGSNRDRFEKELIKGRAYDLFVVVVEASLDDLANGRYKSQMKAHSAAQSIFAFQVRYRLSIVWAGNRNRAEYVTYGLLSKYLREIGERYKLAINGQSGEQKKAGTNLRSPNRPISKEESHGEQL